ncbi:MAG: L-asparaginase, type, partial [Betaproteobacteria bacterium]|nr:L-asparaginase, type [Betaproteobacteria bacterium]
SLSDRERDIVKQSAAQGRHTVFVRSTRVANGRVLGRPDFDNLGIIAADNLSPQKARVLLMLALATTSDVQTIRRIFSEY